MFFGLLAQAEVAGAVTAVAPTVTSGLASPAGPYVFAIVILFLIGWGFLALLKHTGKQMDKLLEQQDKHITVLLAKHDEDRSIFKQAINDLSKSLNGIDKAVTSNVQQVTALGARVEDIENDVTKIRCDLELLTRSLP